MTVIKQARRDLAERLREELPDEVAVVDHWPERVDAPCVLLSAGNPYVTAEGVPFGKMRITHELTLVAKSNTANEITTDNLDDLIEAVWVALDGDAVQVGTPVMLEANGIRFMTASMSVNNIITP